MVNNKHNYISKTLIRYFLGNMYVLENLADELVKRLQSLLRNISQRKLSVIFYNHVFSFGSSKDHHNITDFS